MSELNRVAADGTRPSPEGAELIKYPDLQVYVKGCE